jgi:hypothetical protein
MMVRKATVEEIPALVEMGRKFHAMSPHRFMGEYRPEAVAGMLDYMAANAILLTNGEGVIGGIVAPVYFDPAKLMAEESFWWADRGGGELLDAFEREAWQRGASFVLLSTLQNDRSHVIDRVISRKGYIPVERRYIKELN